MRQIKKISNDRINSLGLMGQASVQDKIGKFFSNIKYNPIDKRFKSVVGAVATEQAFSIYLEVEGAVRGVFFNLVKEGESIVRYKMTEIERIEGNINRYCINLRMDEVGLYFYSFQIAKIDGDVIRVCCGSDLSPDIQATNWWQLTVYNNSVGTTDGLQNSLGQTAYYQIMVDRFCIGGDRLKTKDNGSIYRDDWGGVPEFRSNKDGQILNNDFFGGNLKGVIKKLHYIKKLGVSCIYLCPIFEARSNHKYDTGHYRKVDSDFGTVDDLKRLIARAEKKGIKIMLDGVFSHTGDDSIYFNKYGRYDSKGAFNGKDSPYYDWYNFNECTGTYDSWWGIDTLPNVNENNDSYIEYMTGEDGIIKYWTELGIGGWRFDVVDELPDKFLRAVNIAVKSVNKDCLTIGEVWEDASLKVAYGQRRKYLLGGQLDSVMNYPFKDAILGYIKSGESLGLSNVVANIINNYPKSAVDNLMNLLGTHDTVRIATTLGDCGQNDNLRSREKRAVAVDIDRVATIEKIKAAAVLQFCLPGTPSIYYGDEIGMQGFEDPFNRGCYPWGNVDKLGKKLLTFYKLLARIRQENFAVFGGGAYSLIESKDGVFAFSRKEVGDSKKEIIVIVNMGDSDFEFEKGCDKCSVDLLTNKDFCGIVKKGGFMVLCEAEYLIDNSIT